MTEECRSSDNLIVNVICAGNFSYTSATSPLQNGTQCPSASPGSAGYYNGPSIVSKCQKINDREFDFLVPSLLLTCYMSSNLYNRICSNHSQSVGAIAIFFTVCDNTANARCKTKLSDICFQRYWRQHAPVNHRIAHGLNSFPDTFYWVFTTLVGGPDKSPETTGGKWIFTAHTLFSLIIAASYTGAVAAFLTSSAGAAQLTDFSSLETGQFTTVVIGPSCPDQASWSANYRGTFVGGNSKYSCNSTGSVQRSSSAITFSIYTTSGLFSRYPDGSTLMYSKSVDPCSVQGAQLGAFDMVLCGLNGSVPDSMFANGPAVVYELTRRLNETGR
eukprot:762820-Hanusia_phi.AAC.9